MHTGRLRRFENRFRLSVQIKARNVTGHCPIKKFDVLRQISDMLAKRLG